MNDKVFYAKKSLMDANDKEANAKKAKAAYDEIKAITKKYNEGIAGGKWNGIMSDHPRDQKVFRMPATAIDGAKPAEAIEVWTTEPKAIIPADRYIAKKDAGNTHIETINGLGISNKAVTVMPVAEQTYSGNVKEAPYVEYKTNLAAGANVIDVKCLPTFRLYRGYKLQYAISVNGDEPQVINVDTPAEKGVWGANVLRGYSEGKTTHQVNAAGQATIRIYLLDPSLVLSRIEVL